MSSYYGGWVRREVAGEAARVASVQSSPSIADLQGYYAGSFPVYPAASSTMGYPVYVPGYPLIPIQGYPSMSPVSASSSGIIVSSGSSSSSSAVVSSDYLGYPLTISSAGSSSSTESSGYFERSSETASTVNNAVPTVEQEIGSSSGKYKNVLSS